MKKFFAIVVMLFGLITASAVLAGGVDIAPAPSHYPKFYIGAGPTWHGFTDVRISTPNVPAPFTVNTDFGTGWHIFLGGYATKHFGFELGFNDPGDVRLSFSGVSGALGGVPITRSFGKLRSYNVSAYGTWRQTLFAPWFYIIAKLGMGWTHLTAHAWINGIPLFDNTVDSFALAYGAGFGFNLGDFGIRTMYTKFDISDHTDATITPAYNPDTIDVSLIWCFIS